LRYIEKDAERKSMKLIRHISILILGFAFLASGVWAGMGNSNVGTRIFNFLKIEVAAKPTSMGGAFTGIANDPSALYYNPAGTADLAGQNFIAGYQNNVFDMQSGLLGFIHPTGEGKKISAYVNYLNYGNFIKTDNNGVQDGTFSGSDMLFAVGYSMALKNNLRIGGMAKFIYEKVENFSASGAALDLSAKYGLNDKVTNFGLMIQNLGTQLSKFDSDSKKYSLPTAIRGGVSTRPKGLPLLIAGDIVAPFDNDVFFCLGAEYVNLKPLFLRLGWTSYGSNYKTNSSEDNLAGFSAGFGIEYHRMQISYSISPQAELGTSHRITLTGGFD